MSKITIADYLVKQLSKLNVSDFFGVPGDYNFNLVDAVINSNNTKWIGCTNELNAGYAADGYAREKGYGAIITTYGVGELSAINAVAGCMSENVPIIKITGVPETSKIKNRTLIHHNLDCANYYSFFHAFENIVEEASFLTKENAKYEIDRLINTMVKTKKPVYVAIPIDVSTHEIENIETEIEYPKSDTQNLDKAVNYISSILEKSENPIIIADILTKRFNASDELNTLINKTNIPSTCFIRGLDIIHSGTKNYFGSYAGKYDNKICYDYLNKADCILGFGCVLSDLNTMNFDFSFDMKKFININSDYTIIEGIKYNNVLIKDVIARLNQKLKYKYDKTYERTFKYKKSFIDKIEFLNCKYIYSRLNEFLRNDDIFINEVGLSSFGVMQMELPKKIDVQNQILWGSIGWATPCVLGCSIANRNKRVILITGEGAHQITAQEISTIMRNKLKPVIFVINNSGYTVERILSDKPDAQYNDISCWNYSLLPKVFKGDCYTKQVKTNKEFDEVLKEISNIDKMCYIELFTQYLDVPLLSKSISKLKSLANY